MSVDAVPKTEVAMGPHSGRRVLVLFTTSGNQSYIFASKKLKEVVGASELVRQSTECWPGEQWDKRWGEPPAPLLESSGKSIFQLPLGVPEERAREWIQRVTTLALERAPGLLLVGVCTSVDADVLKASAGVDRAGVGGAGPSAKGAVAVAALFKAAEAAEQRVRAANARRAAHFGLSRSCVSLGAPALRGVQDEPLSAEAQAKREGCADAIKRLKTTLSVVPRSAGSRSVVVRHLQNTRLASNLEKLDALSPDLRRIGVVHADFDGLGALFQQCSGLVEMGNLSRKVAECAREAFSSALADIIAMSSDSPQTPQEGVVVLPLISGGDDLTVIAPARTALRFAQRYSHHVQAWRSQSSPKLRFTACVGVAIGPVHHPFDRLYEVAEACTANAKKARLTSADGANVRQPKHAPADGAQASDEGVEPSAWIDFEVVRQLGSHGATSRGKHRRRPLRLDHMATLLEGIPTINDAVLNPRASGLSRTVMQAWREQAEAGRPLEVANESRRAWHAALGLVGSDQPKPFGYLDVLDVLQVEWGVGAA